MQKTLEQKITRAKGLLQTAKHAAKATVNEDGTPHNTPFMFMHDESLGHIFWCSHPASQHSQNVARSGRIFVVLYDAFERGGLFMEAVDAQQLNGGEGLETAYAAYTALLLSRGQRPMPIGYFMDDNPQRLWSARITHLWVNGTLRDADDNIIRDVRTEVNAGDLLR